MTKTSVCVIGAGAIGRAHAQTVATSDFATLSSVVDPTGPGRAFAQSLGCRWFATHGDMLAAGAPEAAIIATPNDTHKSVALDLIDAGIPSIVEKPIAGTMEDAEAISQASIARGVPTLVGHHRRYNPIVAKARELIADGAVGRLTNVSILYTQYKPAPYFDLAWRKQTGGGPILINLIHEIDLVRFVMGEIASVQAASSNAVRGFDVEDTAAVLLRLVNGCLVTISLSDTAAAPWSWDLTSGESTNYPPQAPLQNSHFISGTDGSLALPSLEHWSYRGDKSWFAPISQSGTVFERGDPYVVQLRHLCGVARGEEKPLITATDGTATLRATMAVTEAARTGAKIEIAAR